MTLPDLPRGLPDWPWPLVRQRFSADRHGDYTKWAAAIDALPAMTQTSVSYGATVTVTGTVDDTALAAALDALHPWRKGPFQIGGVKIDTEWRSDWKWARLQDALPSLAGARVLDVGCGNGYFGWRMLERDAEEVIGIDPTLLFCMQHRAIAYYTRDPRNWVLPLKIEELPWSAQFDYVFSMGVVYHRRDPLEHVRQLAALSRPGGRVVLESLVVEGPAALTPPGRYARMRNVWCVPRVDDMRDWMDSAGLTDITTVDVSPTTTDEQRTTPWMRFESLAESLDSRDPSRTVEGHPAPVRAIVIGTRT